MASDPLIGKNIDSFRILEVLGIGGMGIVYKAIDENLNRFVALKKLNPLYAQDENFLLLFRREARSQAQLEHPNIVRIHAFREGPEGLFLILGYVDGHTLSEILRKGPIPWQQALPIFEQCLSAIGYAHRQGVIHRDLKPGNIMLTNDGQVRITDFGLAKMRHTGDTTLTPRGGIAGTLYYMSPEQVQGRAEVDHRSDLYSLGMTFYEVLAGKPPFNKSDSEYTILRLIVESRFPSPVQLNPRLPEALGKIVMRSIAKNPGDRYQSAEEMLSDLEKFKSLQVPIPKPPRKIPIWLSVLTFVLLLAVLPIFVPNIYHPIIELFSSSEEPPKPVLDAKLSISTEPAGAFVIANQDSIGFTPITDRLIPPGEYRLTIIKKNYMAIDTTLVLTENQPRSINLILEPQEGEWGSLYVDSQPAGVSVYLDGDFVGTTPYRNERIEPRWYNVRLFKEGYHEITQSIQVRRGEMTPFSKPLTRTEQPPPPIRTGFLHVESEPPGARIIMNGRFVGNTPHHRSYAAGEYRLVLQKEGYQDFSSSVKIEPSETTPVPAILKALQGTLKVLVKPWGTIYIDGDKKAEHMNRMFITELSAGKHRVKVEHSELGIIEKEVMIEANREQELFLDFTRTHTLTIASLPSAGAEIWIDGQLKGHTPKTLSLVTGKHIVEVRMAGFETQKKEIDLDSDIMEPILFLLEEKP